MYPMIPHIVSGPLLRLLPATALPALDPAFDVALPAARDRQARPAGRPRVIDDPAPTYAPLPTVTGAISCVSLPMNAPSSMTVWCLLTPS